MCWCYMSEEFFFNNDESVQIFNKLMKLANENKESQDFFGELSNQLSSLLRSIGIPEFLLNLDKNLITTKQYKGFRPQRIWDGGLSQFSDEDTLFRLERLAIFLCIYIRELSFRLNFSIDGGHDFKPLIQFVKNNKNSFSDNSLWCFDFYDDLPMLIMLEIFHAPNMQSILKIVESTNIDQVYHFIQTKDQAIEKINSWETSLSSKQQEVDVLKTALETYKTGFNFVGLYQGFSNLKDTKDRELFWAKWQYRGFCVALILVPIVEIIWVSNNLAGLDLSKVSFLIFPLITLFLILLWLFRVNLHNIKSIKSQIMQLELRMTLCQFIQSYADSSEKLKGKNKEGFEKFENIIFSSIVSSDEKIPSTFDGMEQVTSLLSALNKK